MQFFLCDDDPFSVFVNGFYLCFGVVDKLHPVGKEPAAFFPELFFEVLDHPFHVESAFAFFEACTAFVTVFRGGNVDGTAGRADVEEADPIGYCFADPFLCGHAFEFCGGFNLGFEGPRKTKKDLFVVFFSGFGIHGEIYSHHIRYIISSKIFQISFARMRKPVSGER